MSQNKSAASQSISNHSETTFPSAQNASGPVRFNMTNDYMFRAVLQKNNKVLRGLICSLLHLSEKEVISAEITNPIILGDSIDNKEFQLDIHIRLNNQMMINLEMQIVNKLNWQNRSILYLCRAFDQLEHGQEYLEAKPAMHIGFLDYTLFDEFPEFYATYKLFNVKRHYIYSDNIALSVVNLSQIDLATEEDKKYHIDHWPDYLRPQRGRRFICWLPKTTSSKKHPKLFFTSVQTNRFGNAVLPEKNTIGKYGLIRRLLRRKILRLWRKMLSFKNSPLSWKH